MKLKIAEPIVITDDSNLEYIRKTYVRETKVNFICKKCGRNYYGILRYLPNDLICKQCNIDQTKLERYGSKTYNNSKQNKLTNLAKYGVESWAQTEEGRRRLSEAAKSESRNHAIKEAFKKRTAEDKKRTEELKQNNIIKKYGSLENFYKIRQNLCEMGCLRKYGIKNAGALNPEKAYNSWGRYYYNNIYFDSSWELAYYIWLVDNNIPFKYHTGFYFEYYDAFNNKHRYYPDFYVNNEWVEIKSNILWDFEKNQIKNQDGTLNEAKTKCIIENNIKLLFGNEIKPYLNYVKNTYGKDFFKLHKLLKK